MSNEDASLNAKFDLAVECIKSLPAEGSFKPSYELMLNFYAFYKQATVGPCREAKPYAWDVKGRYKWDAWQKVSSLSSDEAKMKYVEQLAELLEVMPITDEVQKLGPIIGPFLKAASNKNFTDTTTETAHVEPTISKVCHSSISTTTAETPQAFTSHSMSDTDGEENFCDTQTDVQFEVLNKPINHPSFSSNQQHIPSEIEMTIVRSIRDLHDKVDRLYHEISSVKQFIRSFIAQNSNECAVTRSTSLIRKLPKNPNFILLIVLVWPFMAQIIVKWLSRLRINS